MSGLFLFEYKTDLWEVIIVDQYQYPIVSEVPDDAIPQCAVAGPEIAKHQANSKKPDDGDDTQVQEKEKEWGNENGAFESHKIIGLCKNKTTETDFFKDGGKYCGMK